MHLRPDLITLVAFCCLAPVCARVATAQSLSEPPATAPNGCSMMQVAMLKAQTGDNSYLLLKREVASLQQARLAAAQVIQASAEVRKANGLIEALASFDQGKEGFECASFVIGYPDARLSGENQAMAQNVMVSVYNRLALQTREIRDFFVSLAKAEESANSVSQVGASEDIAAIMKRHNDATSDLVDALSFSFMQTVDTNEKAAKADTLLITCNERADLLRDLAPLTLHPQSNEFDKYAGFLQTLLQKPYKCKA